MLSTPWLMLAQATPADWTVQLQRIMWVHDLIHRTRGAVDSLEERVRRFAAVLDAVQVQAETLLVDATAAARGMHTTAQALREDTDTRGRRGRRQDTESTGRS